MTKKNDRSGDPWQICFGFDRATDEKSLAAFMENVADKSLLATLIPKMSDREISEVVDYLTALMQKHLNDREYHELFLDRQGDT
jgi:hypothetical protein